MEELFNQLYSNGALLVLWSALLFHLILPFPREAHPAILWHKFAEQLADKVNTQFQLFTKYDLRHSGLVADDRPYARCFNRFKAVGVASPAV